MALNSRQIELIAVSKVKDMIARSNVLSPYIAENDKEPSWDGFIYLNAGTEAMQRVAVQVKGKTRKKLSTKPTFPIEVTNLKNYLRDGGVLYFVDYIIGEDQFLYYAKLAPIDLKRYIKQGHGQKSISVKLKPIKESLFEIESDVINFNRDCKRQTSFADSPILTIEEARKQGHKINFQVTSVINKEDALLTLQKEPVYLYAELNNGNITTYYPIGDQAYKVIIGQRHIKEKVVVNGKAFFDEFIVFMEENKCIYVIDE